MADFLSLGEMLIDFTPAGRTPAGIPLFEQNPGGAPANVAVQAARRCRRSSNTRGRTA